MESKQFYDEIARKRKEIESMNIPESEKQRLYDAVDISIRRYEDTSRQDDFLKYTAGLTQYFQMVGSVLKSQSEIFIAHKKSALAIGETGPRIYGLEGATDNLTTSAKESVSLMERIVKEKIPKFEKAVRDLGATAITCSNRGIPN